MSEPSNPIPRSIAHNRPANKRIKFMAGSAIIFIAIIALIVNAIAETGSYWLTVSELRERTPDIYGRQVRVNGAVVDGTIDYNARDLVLQFHIEDDGGQLPIVFHGPKPDNFQRAVEAIVEGVYHEDGTFEANRLLLKCPSRYEEHPDEIIEVHAIG